MKNKDYNNTMMKMYEKGYSDGLVAGKNAATDAYAKMLMDMSGKEAVCELIGSFEKDRIIDAYKAWNEIYHYMLAMSEMLETEHLTAVTSELWEGIKAEITDKYLSASDDYHEATYSDAKFAEKHMKEMEVK